MGLLGAARKMKIWTAGKCRDLAWKFSSRSRFSNGLPIPPPSLRFSVIANYDVDCFLSTGLQGAESIRDILARNGKPIDQFSNILDFGCGCGRITRYLQDLANSSITGSDINPTLIRWAQRNLKFARFVTNGISDALPFENDSFDLVFALSVFTHLGAKLQNHWMDELIRILRPGGVLLVTLKGENWKAGLDEEQMNAFDRGNMVVIEPDYSGTNYCAAYHPPVYAKSVLGAGLNIIEHEPCGAKDISQDFYLMEKSDSQSRYLIAGCAAR